MQFDELNNRREIAELVSMAEEIWHEHYVPIIGRQQVSYMLAELHSQQVIARQIAEQDYRYFFIKQHQNVCGYLGVQFKPSEVFLSKLYVYAHCRGNGAGRKSIEFIKGLAVEHQAEKISLSVNKNNADSIKAYEKFGFVTTGTLCVDIGAGFKMDDYTMELGL